MAASIPFTSIDDVILALAKIDVLHKHIAHAEGDASTIGPGDDFLLIPYCIHDVARGDHLLFDGASFFGESADLRFRVGDRVEVDLDGVWALGSVVRQPVQDGELEAYDVVLDDGRRVLLADDDASLVRAPPPGTARGTREHERYELVFAAHRVRAAHDAALAAMGAAAADVALAGHVGPPDVLGRRVAQIAATVFDEPSDALYAKTVEAAAALLGATPPDDWRQRRDDAAEGLWDAAPYQDRKDGGGRYAPIDGSMHTGRRTRRPPPSPPPPPPPPPRPPRAAGGRRVRAVCAAPLGAASALRRGGGGGGVGGAEARAAVRERQGRAPLPLPRQGVRQGVRVERGPVPAQARAPPGDDQQASVRAVLERRAMQQGF